MKLICKVFDKQELSYFRFLLILNSLMFFLEGLSLLSIPVFTSVLLDNYSFFEKINFFKNSAILNEFNRNDFLILSGISVIFLFIIKNFFLIFLTIFQGKFQKKIKTNISERLFNYHINMPFLQHLETNPSYLSRVVSSEVANLNTYLQNIFLNFRELITISTIFILIIIYSPKFILFIFFGFGFVGIVFLKITKIFINHRAKKNIQLGKNLTETIFETFGSIKDIKVQMKEENVINYFKNDINEFEKNNFYFFIIEKLPRIILELLAILILVLCCVFFVIKGSNISEIFSSLSLILISVFRFLPAFNAVTVSKYYIKLTRPSVKTIISELDKSKNLFLKNKLKNNNKKYVLNERKYLEVKDLSFQYNNKHSAPLKNINFELNKGDFVGIAGTTGAGKSTLFHILLGLLEPNNGIVANYGVDIHNDLGAWRKKIGYISQNIFLLNGSIKKNILLNFNNSENDNFNNEKLAQCIELSELKSKINSLPYGLETHVGINGSKLSGGEKQRLAIARILYKNPEIILMDESTNALDEKTEDRILSNLRSEKFQKKTVIIISHRKNTLLQCDKVLTLINGEIK